MLLQFRYIDPRLKFSHISNITQISGGQSVYNAIWNPIVYVANEWNSVMKSDNARDILIRIDPSGKVVMTTRL